MGEIVQHLADDRSASSVIDAQELDLDRIRQLADDRSASSVIDAQELDLDRIRQLASAAMIVIESQMGRDGPAAELGMLLAVIEEAAEAAELKRHQAFLVAIVQHLADDRSASSVIDAQERDLDRIRQLASAAMIVIENQMGLDGPAAELGMLLVVIEEAAEAAELKRQAFLVAKGRAA